jgi:L-rhamnose isomerase
MGRQQGRCLHPQILDSRPEKKTKPFSRMKPRELLKQSLDEALAEKIDTKY